MSDQLDLEIFTCCVCGGDFDHTQGTWLPIGEEVKHPVSVLLGDVDNPLIILGLDLRKPEVVTSKYFTCYDCTETA